MSMARSSSTTGAIKRRQRGGLYLLPSGAVRARVANGKDRITGKRLYLEETIPAGPDALDEGEKALRRLITQVDEKKAPQTRATVNQVIDAHMPYAKVSESTRRTLIRYANKHIRPLIGEEQAGKVDAELLDRYYAELARCRDHCTKPFTEHRTQRKHTCDARCGPHICKPLADWSIRKIHFFLSAAFETVRRWTWVSMNPIDLARPPAAPQPDPQPPTPEEAALLLNAAWQDVFFGTLVWVAFTTSPRRAELCGLRWKHFEPKRARLAFHRNIVQDGADIWEKDTKTGQKRHIALDEQTNALLIDYRDYCEEQAKKLGLKITRESFIFSLTTDGSQPYRPETLTQRYNRLAQRLGIETTFRRVRHYSATELIVAGVDIRTVAGRLGHSGGGTTTLKVYAAWVSEADQRASKTLLEHVPPQPPARVSATERAKTAPSAPYEEIAAAIRRRILSGEIADGSVAPSIKEVAATFSTSIGTAHRAVGLLHTWGLLSPAGRGIRPTVINTGENLSPAQEGPAEPPLEEASKPRELTMINLTLLRNGDRISSFSAQADPHDPSQLKRLLIGAARRRGHEGGTFDDYELEIRNSGSPELVSTFVVL
ncbi:tyrosine-type recombinase/integrase [Amycolatopsis sp. NPDC047767]|uniref:tyrosine-type recombinase/integrase n=1 Tax=Amycolatopsis sp. NPDC047767 TaxID=3156765 RepID=UPI003453479C